MRAFLSTLVYDQAMVTDELVQQRYEISAEPKTVEWTKKMFSNPGRFEELWRELDKIPRKHCCYGDVTTGSRRLNVRCSWCRACRMPSFMSSANAAIGS